MVEARRDILDRLFISGGSNGRVGALGCVSGQNGLKLLVSYNPCPLCG